MPLSVNSEHCHSNLKCTVSHCAKIVLECRLDLKGKALTLLRTISSKKIFEELIQNFKSHLRERGYPKNLVQRTLSEAQFKNRKLALLKKTTEKQTNLAFRYTVPPSSDELETNPHERMAFNRATTIGSKKSKKPAPHILQKEGGQSDTYT